uniref:Uncharacterized protein n=1 Tax=Lactuca sativa TaxID=4236 RepID=A0A9R1X4D5_LACSA|nr:hypothetical protein LSAT_V11C700368220 [Lactuca sativa]
MVRICEGFLSELDIEYDDGFDSRLFVVNIGMFEKRFVEIRNLKRVEMFRKAHTDKNSVFVSFEAEQQYNRLMEDLLEQKQGPGAERDLTPAQERATFKKILGERPGHIRGIS